MAPPHPSPGFVEILHTTEFSAWEASTSTVLGFHSSLLRDAAAGFRARYRWGRIGPLQLLHLCGRGALELEREQVETGVLWLPLRDCGEERINGRCWRPQPGQALLIRPGDQLLGRTSAAQEGLSLLLPAALFADAPPPLCSPLLGQERPATGALIRQVLLLRQAMEQRDPGGVIAAQEVLDRVAEVLALPDPAAEAEAAAISRSRRWQLVVEASRWMQSRLAEPFSLEQLCRAVDCPTRTLQHAFASELGRSPLAQARMLRLRALRQLLQQAPPHDLSIAAAMGRCGLLANGSTARAYTQLYGERPRQTRARTG